MKSPLRNIAAVCCLGLFTLSTYAEAKWLISKNLGTNKIHTINSAGKMQTHFVQIFSSINPTKAEGMKNTLEMQGYPAFIKIKAQPARSFYQVQVGPFSSRSLADNAKDSIVQLYPQFPFLNEAILKISYQN